MLDNSILSIGTIRVLNSFGIVEMGQLTTQPLPKVGDKPHFLSSNIFKQRNLDEINTYFDSIGFITTPTLQTLNTMLKLANEINSNCVYKAGLIESITRVIELEELTISL